MSHSQNQEWNGKCYGYLERHANPPVTSQFLGFSVSHLPHFWVWKTISDFRQFFFFGVFCVYFYRGVCLATIPCRDFFEDFSRWGALVMVMFTTTPAGTIPPWLAPWKCQQKLWKMASFSMIRIEHGDFQWLHQKKVARKTLRPHHHIWTLSFRS